MATLLAVIGAFALADGVVAFGAVVRCCVAANGLIAGEPTMFLSPITLTPQLIWTTMFLGRCIFWLTVATIAAVSLGTSGGCTAMIFPEP
jgi:hypothetical protein